MKKLLFIITAAFIFNDGFAQFIKVQNMQAFYTVAIPGMQRSDENGNKINPDPIYTRFILLEWRFNQKPEVDTVFYNGVACKATVVDKEETETKIGIRRADGKPVMLSPKKGNHVWRIEVEPPAGTKPIAHEIVKKIQLKGRLGKIKFSTTVTTETELTTFDRY